jgi:hypothetical protein
MGVGGGVNLPDKYASLLVYVLKMFISSGIAHKGNEGRYIFVQESHTPNINQ